MRAFEDGWIDERSRRPLTEAVANPRTPDDVRSEVDAFRGRILSLAYRLERLVDELIVWHLFRDRQDGMAGEFEENVLHDGGLGFERKVRLARKIAEGWLYREDDVAGYGKLLTEAKSYRDRVAHWPTRLQPLVDASDNPVDFLPHIEKGQLSFALTSPLRDDWLAVIEKASNATEKLIERITEHCRTWGE